MLKQIQQYTSTKYGVELGHGFNIKNTKEGIFGCVRKAYLDTHPAITRPDGGGATNAKITSSTVEAGLFINGSLEINADFAEVVKVSGKAHMDLANQDKKTSIARSFYSFSYTTHTYLDATELTPADLAASGATHIVTDIFYGKGLTGTMTLTDQSKDHSLAAGGSLEVTALSIPINGKGAVDFKKKDVDINISFESSLTTANYKEPMQATDMDTYLQQVQEYFDDPGEPAIVKFTLTPLAILNNFKSAKGMPATTPFYEPLNTMVKRQFVQSERLMAYIKELKNEIPQEGKYIEQRVAVDDLHKFVVTRCLDFVELTKKGDYATVKTMVQDMTAFNINSLDILLHKMGKTEITKSVKLAKQFARKKRAAERAARKSPSLLQTQDPEQYYTFESLKFPGFFMNVQGGKTDDGVPMQLYANPGNQDSQWRLATNKWGIKGENSEFFIQNKHSRTNGRWLCLGDDGRIRQNEKGSVFRLLRKHSENVWLIQIKDSGNFIKVKNEDAAGKENPLHQHNSSGLSSLWKIRRV